MHELELAKRAVTDLAEISRYSRSQFGALVASRYLAGIDRALERVADALIGAGQSRSIPARVA